MNRRTTILLGACLLALVAGVLVVGVLHGGGGDPPKDPPDKPKATPASKDEPVTPLESLTVPAEENVISPVRSDPAARLAEADPAFARYVDWGLVGQAVTQMDAGPLADAALALAEAERVFMRTHKSGVTADQLAAKAVKLASLKRDQKTIDRLGKAGETLNKPGWAKLVAEAKEFGAKSRDPGPKVSLADTSPETVAMVQGVLAVVAEAEFRGDATSLQGLKEALGKDGSLKGDRQAYLLKQVEAAVARCPKEPDEIAKLLDEFTAASREDSNRNEVRRNLENGWNVIWGKNFTEGDWIQGTAAIAESIAAENPGPFLRWFTSVVDENIAKIQSNLPGVARRDIERWIVQSLKSKHIIAYRGFQIQAGFATYDRWQRIVYDEPATVSTNYPPFFKVIMVRKERRINLPNWHQFYIRYRWI